MSYLVLNDEQAKVVAGALKPIPVRDADGNLLGTLSPVWTEADITEARTILESEGTWKTTEQVLARLQALEQK